MVAETDLNTHMPNAVRGGFAEVLSRRAIDPFVVRLTWDPAAINKGRRDEQSGTTVAMSRGMHRLLSNGCRDEDDHDDDDDDDDEESLNAPGETYADPSLDCIKAPRVALVGQGGWVKDGPPRCSPPQYKLHSLDAKGTRDLSLSLFRRPPGKSFSSFPHSFSLRGSRPPTMKSRQPLSQFSDLDAKHLPGSELSLISFDAAVSNVESSKSDNDHRKTWREFCRSAIMRVCILQMDNVTVSSSGILNYTTSTV
ncbi:hypothetical protein ALC57_10271 [Trachymyrmex cornetzi]|uniref:Uncharacterized protein n=1 Tax=Trachymyrmex cornetzi TaxID=471704 RepID=A0A195DXY8_9HYME|nr:hypothetical protein ALC57_10271 [Trachymyrmex cornetzi]